MWNIEWMAKLRADSRISEIAEHLNVKPVEPGDPVTITSIGADGRAYDLLAVIRAYINRIPESDHPPDVPGKK